MGQDEVPSRILDLITSTQERVAEAERLNPHLNRDQRDQLAYRFTMDDPHGDLDVLLKLRDHPEMPEVWRALRRPFGDDDHLYAQFARKCMHIRNEWNFAPKRTPAEHKRHFEGIAADLMDVVNRIVVEPSFGRFSTIPASLSPVRLVSDDAIEDLIANLDAMPADGVITKEEDEISYTRFQLEMTFPDLHRYARWIADKAISIAEEGPASDRPHRDSAARTYFVRTLSRWLQKTTGGRMHETVAAVASALFDEPITADHVRKLVETDPEVSLGLNGRKLPRKADQ